MRNRPARPHRNKIRSAAFGVSPAAIYTSLKQDRVDSGELGTHGALRVTAELRYGRNNVIVDYGAVESIMRELGI